MPSSQRRVDTGTEIARDSLLRMGRELRDARIAAGLSQERLAAAAGISHGHVSRIEHGVVPNLSMLAMARVGALLGLRVSCRAYPMGPPIRDAAHVALLGRLRAELGPGLRMRTEVPLRSAPGDLRAWDAEVLSAQGDCKVEAETRLADLQSLERRIALKMQDDGVSIVVLLVAGSRSNRAVLAHARVSLRERFPCDTRAILRALRRGEMPPASGICVL